MLVLRHVASFEYFIEHLFSVIQLLFRTYAEANRDSAIILAETCMKFENIKDFVYMSANHAVPPFLPGGYIKAKIETENSLAVLPLHTLIIRPSKPTIFLIF